MVHHSLWITSVALVQPAAPKPPWMPAAFFPKQQAACHLFQQLSIRASQQFPTRQMQSGMQPQPILDAVPLIIPTFCPSGQLKSWPSTSPALSPSTFKPMLIPVFFSHFEQMKSHPTSMKQQVAPLSPPLVCFHGPGSTFHDLPAEDPCSALHRGSQAG